MVDDLGLLENLITKYKTEIDPKKKQVLYLNLVSETLKLVKKIASGIHSLPSGVGNDDLVQVGALGVLKAIDSYKTEDKGSFKTYVTICIKGKILQFLRDKAYTIKPPRDLKENETRSIISLDEAIFSPDGVETILDRVSDEDFEQTYENKKMIEFALNKLANQEKEAIYKYYIEGLKKKEIAQELNISAMQATRLIKRALKKMYRIISKDIKE